MKISDLATPKVITAAGFLSVQQAARKMRDTHVGDIVITVETRGGERPIGIVTDRDITIGVTALGLDPSSLTLAEIMNPRLFTAHANDDADSVLQSMRRIGIRRAPVVDDAGLLSGMFTLDDYLEHLARRLLVVNGLIRKERNHEQHARLALT